MKNVLALVALTLALGLSACTKKDAAAPAGDTNAAPVEGTTTTPPASENGMAPAKEMEGSTATITNSNVAPAAGSGAVNNPMATPSTGSTAPGGAGAGTAGATNPGSEGK